MFGQILNLFLQNMSFFGSYSNEMFPPPLSHEDEIKYITLMKNGDKDARNKLIEHNLRLVAHIVKKFDTNNNDIDDLIGIGTVGLIKGIDTYSLDENEILMYFRSNKKNSKNISIYEGISYDKEGNEITILDVLKTKDPDYLEELYIKDNIVALKKYLNLLTPRERKIIDMRYGLNNQDELTQKEIAKIMKISRSYVSRIEKRAITKMLRAFIKDKKII